MGVILGKKLLENGRYEFTVLNDKGEVVKVTDFSADNALSIANTAIPVTPAKKSTVKKGKVGKRKVNKKVSRRKRK